jgi:hypothetical protein
MLIIHLNTDNKNTCVIDNFIGMYGKELKLTRDALLYYMKIIMILLVFGNKE